MNNNIGNMNSASPLGFNPQGHRAHIQAENIEPQEAQTETAPNTDLLKHVPGDQYGRAMVNKSQAAYELARQNVEDDLFTFELINDFVNDLTQGYIEKGIEPKRAREMAALSAGVLLNLEQ